MGSTSARGSYLQYLEGIRGMKVCIPRYANVCGPRQDPQREAGAVAIFADAVLRGERPRVFADGTQQEALVYVGDVARGCLATAGPPCSGPINIGTGRLTSANQCGAPLFLYHPE